MTEQQWPTATDPIELWNAARQLGVGLRRLRLCAVAYCKVVSELTAVSQKYVEALLYMADGSEDQTHIRNLNACGALEKWPGWAVNVARGRSKSFDALLAEMVARAHDVFGNPFRPVAFSPAWRTDTAVALARQVYESREFSAMPILADALQDAGCDNEAILNHCRSSSVTHVRGCWAIDLVLNRE
jgi:hypothetical protein